MRARRAEPPYPPGVTPVQVPPAFAAGVQALTARVGGQARPGLALRLVPAPRKMAPFSVAVAAEVSRGDLDVASGRLVVLHDPHGQQGWRGDTRVVSLVEAQVEAEMATDPALADVGWSWLLEALEQRGAAHLAAGGTVTRTVSKRFGQLEDPEDATEVEIRASWTVLAQADGALDLERHLLAWCDLLCSTSGLPPEGVLALHHR